MLLVALIGFLLGTVEAGPIWQRYYRVQDNDNYHRYGSPGPRHAPLESNGLLRDAGYPYIDVNNPTARFSYGAVGAEKPINIARDQSTKTDHVETSSRKTEQADRTYWRGQGVRPYYVAVPSLEYVKSPQLALDINGKPIVSYSIRNSLQPEQDKQLAEKSSEIEKSGIDSSDGSVAANVVHRPLALPAAYILPYRLLHSSLEHTQDSLGQYDYTYRADSSAKTESRAIDGTTRGAYSYIDPNGILQQVHYIADRNGFRVLATNLPEAK